MRNVDHLYIHIPFCSGKCAYCNLYSVPYSDRAADSFLDSLAQEARLRLGRNLCRRPRTVYMGGGTPSVLSPAHLQRLVTILQHHLQFDALDEWTVEANPGTWSREKLDILRDAGVTRVSLGLQAMTNEMLLLLGRRHSVESVRPTIQLIRDAGIADIGVDLIAALPGVSVDAWDRTLNEAASLDIQHVSVYSLTLEPGTDLYRRCRSGELRAPDETAQLAALAAAQMLLEGSGFGRYEVSNYAQPGHECVHNLAYWRGKDYLGLGPAAASRVGRRRCTQTPSLDAYTTALRSGNAAPVETETLAPDTDAGERLAFAFRLREGVDMSEHPAADARQKARWSRALAALQAEGLLSFCSDCRWHVTDRGWNYADRIAAEMLA